MSKKREQNWYPISKLPLFRSMIDGYSADTEESYNTFFEGRKNPHVLDDATIDRALKVYNEQLEYIDCHDRQISRWCKQRLSESQSKAVDKLSQDNKGLRKITKKNLELLKELRKGTIDCIMEMEDAELGLNYLLGKNKKP